MISVIVPVYNVERYLRECLTSIQNQSYRNIEVLIVNDCSPDQSQTIVDEFVSADSRFTSLRTDENGGLSRARNLGLDHCRGTWVTFVDSDDVVLPNAFTQLLNLLRDGGDVAIGSVLQYDEVAGRYLVDGYYGLNPIMSQWDDMGPIEGKLLVEHLPRINCSAWGKLYRRSTLVENVVRFPPGLAFEDNVFFWHYMLIPHIRFCSTAEPVYLYRSVRVGAITSDPSRAPDVFKVGHALREKLVESGFFSEFEMAWCWWLHGSFHYWMWGRAGQLAPVEFFVAAAEFSGSMMKLPLSESEKSFWRAMAVDPRKAWERLHRGDRAKYRAVEQEFRSHWLYRRLLKLIG